MTTQRETPRRSVRVPDDRWARFGVLAAHEGTSASAKLNAYMQTVIDETEGAADND